MYYLGLIFCKMNEMMKEATLISCDFSIMFKNYCASHMKYGRQSYDFQEGSIVCIAPKQIYTLPTLSIVLQYKKNKHLKHFV